MRSSFIICYYTRWAKSSKIVSLCAMWYFTDDLNILKINSGFNETCKISSLFRLWQSLDWGLSMDMDLFRKYFVSEEKDKNVNN